MRSMRQVAYAMSFFVVPGVALADGWEFRSVIQLFDVDPTDPARVVLGFEAPALNEAGQVGFIATVPGSPFAAAFLEDGGAFSRRAMVGDTAPGTAETFATLQSLRLTAAGDVAFRGVLATDPSNAPDRFVLHREIGGALELVQRGAEPAPGLAGPVVGVFGDPGVNAAGATAYAATLSGGGVTLADNLGLFRRDPDGTTTLIARMGDVLPDGPGAPGELRPGDSGPLSFLSFTDVHVAGDGAVIFRADISGDSGSGMAAFRIDPDGTLTRLARGADSLGAGEPSFTGLDLLAADADGRIAFTAFQFGGASGRTLIRGTTGDYEVIARTFDAAPDTPDFSFRDFIGISLNEDGRAATLARLWDGPLGAITGEGPTSLFAELDGGLSRVLSVGDVLEVAPGDLRTIGALSVASSLSGPTGPTTSQPFFNAAGQVAFRAFYEGGGGGIFVASRAAAAAPVIPLPPALATFVVALAALSVISRRRTV